MAAIRRARRWTGESALNLDSLVDVVTNTNGMLILLAVFTTVMAMGKTYEVSYPMVRETDQQPVLLEAQDGRVVLVHRKGELGEPYRPLFLGDSIALLREDGEWGESGQEMRRPESEFRQVVAAIDPAEEYLFFLVRPDGFEAFRTARELVWETRPETAVGWEPLVEDTLLAFGEGGQILKPQ
jgi:hypothetical protein